MKRAWMSRWSVSAAAVLVALATSVSLADPYYGPNPWSDGHGDIGVSLDEGLHVHLHAGAIVDGVALPGDDELDPADITILVNRTTLATANTAAALGIAVNDSFWELPLGAVLGTPFVGWGLEPDSDWVGNSVTFTLLSMTGPTSGAFANYAVNFNNFTFETYMKTVDGIDPLIDKYVLVGPHSHTAWGFTKEGIYKVELLATGVHKTAGSQSFGGTITFNVGPVAQPVPEPSAFALMGFGGLAMAGVAWRRHRAGKRSSG